MQAVMIDNPALFHFSKHKYSCHPSCIQRYSLCKVQFGNLLGLHLWESWKKNVVLFADSDYDTCVAHAVPPIIYSVEYTGARTVFASLEFSIDQM